MSNARKINWKRQRKREAFFLKTGRMPYKKELSNSQQPHISYGYNTTKG